MPRTTSQIYQHMNYWILFLVLLNKLLQYCHRVWNARSVLAERERSHRNVPSFGLSILGAGNLTSIPQGPTSTTVTNKCYSEYVLSISARQICCSYFPTIVQICNWARYGNKVT